MCGMIRDVVEPWPKEIACRYSDAQERIIGARLLRCNVVATGIVSMLIQRVCPESVYHSFVLLRKFVVYGGGQIIWDPSH